MKAPSAILLTAFLAALSTRVVGQVRQQPQTPTSVGSRYDPNEVICEKQAVLGSRLAHRKVCMTRSQWEDARRQDRSDIEKAQMQRGMSGGGG